MRDADLAHQDPLHHLWKSIVLPPYKALPWLILIYVVVSSFVYTDNGPFTGHIVGFDDQSRMTQVRQWINGDGWYDRVITRTNAPEGFHTIWARIVDVPIAAVVVAAELFTDQHTAALAASVIVPLLELLLMFHAARYYARPIAGKKEAWLVLLFLMFTTVLNHKIYTLAGFHLGEASHHAWYGILNVLMFGAAVRIVLGVAGLKPQIMLGVAIALLLAVGIEGFPMIAGVAGILAVIAWYCGNHWLAERGAVGVGFGSLFSLILLPMHVPPQDWFEISFIQPSIMGPLMTAIAAGFLFGESRILPKIKNRMHSALLLICIAGIAACVLLQIFPEILAGGTAALSPNERKLAAAEHPEVWTMWRVASDITDYVGLVMPSLLAIGTAILGISVTNNKRRRMMYAAYGGCVALPSSLAQVYWRYIHHAQTAVCPLLLHLWQSVRQSLWRRKFYRTLSLAALIMIGPFWMVFLPAIDMNAPFVTQVLFFPAKIYTEPYTCDPLSFTDYLNKNYSPTTNINVPDWDSSAFLYETDLHIDFLSNYPSNDHFIDNRVFFQTQDVNTAKEIAKRHGINLVAMCVYIPMSEEVAKSRPYREPSMIERMREGALPRWMKPVPTGVNTSYRLFAVDQAALQQGK